MLRNFQQDADRVKPRWKFQEASLMLACMPDDDGERLPMTGAVDQSSRQYLKLLRAVGDELGHRRGWQKYLAARLAVSSSFLSKVLAEKVPAGAEAVRRVCDRWEVPVEYFAGDGDPPSEVVSKLAGLVLEHTSKRIPLEKASPDEPGRRPPLVDAHRRAVRSMRAEAGPMRGVGLDPHTDYEAIIQSILDTRFIKYVVAHEMKRLGRDEYVLPPSFVVSQFINDFADLVEYLRHHPEEPTVFDMLDETRMDRPDT